MKVNSEKLINKLNEKWKGINCPYCQTSQWTVEPTIVTPITVDENKAMQIGGEFQPLIPVSCRNCGNTVLINGLILGCLDDVNKEKEGEKKDGETK